MKHYIGGFCARNGCRLLAERVLVVILHPPDGIAAPPYGVVIGMSLCEGHANEAELKDFLDDQMEVALNMAYHHQCGVVPDLKKSQLTSTPLYTEATQENLRLSGLRPQFRFRHVH